MSGLRSVWNEHGDRMTYYDHDGKPDHVLEMLRGNFGHREESVSEKRAATQTIRGEFSASEHTQRRRIVVPEPK